MDGKTKTKGMVVAVVAATLLVLQVILPAFFDLLMSCVIFGAGYLLAKLKA